MSVVFERLTKNICGILINRPHKRNALNIETIKRLQEALDKFEHDSEFRVAILGGIGGNFCAGYDLNEFVDTTTGLPNIYNIEKLLWPLGTRLSDNKITVAAIDGHAAGFGLELALKCDFRIAEQAARLGFMNRRFSIPIMNGGTLMTPRLIGTSRALELIATGKAELVHDAIKSGLITYICDIGCSIGRSLNLARCLAKFPQEAMIRDVNQVRYATSKSDLEYLKKERTQALEFLQQCEPLDNAVKFLRGEICRHGNMDMGNLTNPNPDVSL